MDLNFLVDEIWVKSGRDLEKTTEGKVRLVKVK